MSKKILSLLSIFFLMLFVLVGCKDPEGKITIQVESEMKVGETYQVKYELENLDDSVELSWKVSDTAMAELDSAKLTIKALKEGSFTLTVTAKSGETASKEVTVVKGDAPAQKYTISWDLAGGAWDGAEGVTEFTEGEKVTLPTPNKEGYKFLGWYQGDAKVTEIASQNYTLVAKWEEVVETVKYTISYELNGGKAENAPTEYDGTVEVVLPTPVFAGYEFKGWYEDAEFTSAVVTKIAAGTTGNKAFYAKWETVEYTISYELNGGAMEGATTVYTVESQDILLPNPTKEGYVFKGWYANANFSGSAVTKVAAGSTGDKAFYAKWEVEQIEQPEPKPGVYTITYEVNGGTLLNAPAEYDGSKDVYLYTPLRHGYDFIGWYDNASFTGDPIEKIAKGASGDVKLYAYWVAIPQSIVYELNGGAWGETEGPSYYTIDKEVLLVEPVLENAIFLGWYNNADFEGEVIEKIEAGRQGEVKLYAKWEYLTVKVVFDLAGGAWADLTVDAFAEELVADFNTYGGSTTETVRENFKATSHPQIKSVFALPEMLEKYKWFFEFSVAELEAATNANIDSTHEYYKYFTSTKEMLEKMIAGDTEAISGDYADARTLWRFFVEGLINNKLPAAADIYAKSMVDYSKPENMVRFLTLISETEAELAPTDELPTPVKPGYNFLGWYLGEEKVEAAVEGTLVAKWESGHVHVEETIPGYEATCEEPGLTEGKKCSECGEILVPQEEIPALGHSYVDGKCTVCGADDPNYQPAEKPDMTIVDAFAAELVGDFNTYGGSTTETVRENFKATSHPQIKSVFALPEMLEKYKWFFEFSLKEITDATNANIDSTHDYYVHYENTKIMLEGMIAGDTNAVNINDGGNARTLWRFWVEGLINAKLPAAADIYAKSMVDYSVDANLNRFIAAYKEANTPKPNRDDLEVFAKQIVDLFNSTGASDAKVTTREDFKATTHPNIKYVWNKAENLEAYKWLFEFALEEITAAATENAYLDNGYYTNIKGLLEKMIAGDTTAVGGDYANGRTILRWWIQGLINATLAPADDVYAKLMVDYSVEENLNRFLVLYALNKPSTPEHTHTEEVLPGKDATCEEPGLTEGKKCSECGEILVPQEEIPALGHSYVDGKCTVCGADDPNYNPDQPELPGGNVIYVDDSNPDLDAAIASAKDGDTIQIAAGEYGLSAVINKSLTFVGPNADLAVDDYKAEEALINVSKDVAGNLAAKNIVFNGVHLKGTGGGPGIPGISFQDGGNIEKLVFKSCVLSDTNTFLKVVNGKSAMELTFENCYIHTIGQFVLWTATSDITKTTLLGNYVDATNCGGVTNAAAALFRVRSGSLEAYGNYFKGDSANTPGYFEALNDSVVKYNTFDTVSRFVHPTAANKLVFDQNLYLNASGEALTAAPSTLAGGGSITADATVAKSAEEVKQLYEQFVMSSNPNRYYTIEFDAGLGEITSSCPTLYDTNIGIAILPTAEREGYKFLGWYLNDVKIESIPAGTTGDLKVVAKWEEPYLIVDGADLEDHFDTITEALAAAKDGDTIKLVAGEYTENITISVPNLTILGPNAGISANSNDRTSEAVMKGVITVTSQGQGLTIDGLSFTGDAKVKYGESVTYDGFNFLNNKVYDTTVSAKAWDESRYTLPGFIQFTMASGGTAKNIQIFNNSFVNVSEVNVLLNRSYNVTVDGNVFKDFGLDAVRTEGGYVYGILSFTNNVFEQTTAGKGGVGIFLYSNAGGSGTTTTIIIKNNEFIKVGSNNGTVFTSAIAAYRFQENPTTFTIANNVFDHCYDYLYLRNNGGNSGNWSCTVENNQFLGLPANQYYGSYRGSDSESTNPHLAVFTQNYYEDNSGNVITDLSAYASYFKHMASYGTALATKPGEVEVEPVELWEITYDLNGGETKEAFVYNYTSLNDAPIALPTLEKPNHQFNGWLLNEQLVSAIPADAEGDLHLVADFSLLEGEVYTIELITNKENVIWPSRQANDREEIIDTLFADLYEWAKGNGETRSYADYEAYIRTELAAYNDIKLRNTTLGNYPAEDGSTEYFLNVPKYYQKWNEFFAVFHKAMLAVNADQSFYTDTYATMVRLNQFITWSTTGQNYFNSYLPKMCAATKVLKEVPTTYRGGQIVELPQLSMANGLEFLGWYDNADFNGEVITTINNTDTGNKVFYAKWAEEIKPETVEVNKIDRLLLFTTHQLVWSLTPENITNKEVEFFSSNEAVATVNAKGVIEAHALGTTTITMKVYGNRELDVVFDLTVYANDYINATYESESYVVAGKAIGLNAEVVKQNGTIGSVKWESLTPDIATVDANGVVTGVKAGVAKILVTDAANPELKAEILVTVLDTEATGILEFLLDSHESNVFTRLNLNIGSTYNKDIFGSVSKVFFQDYSVDESLLAKGNAKRYGNDESNRANYVMDSIEFITVHYTGNMAKGADAEANGKYFVDASQSTSIHYTTGNDGIYHCQDNDLRAAHAGDSGSLDVVGTFKWMPTGVQVAAGDPMYPEFTISQDFYYEINGKKTTVPMPKPWNYSGRGTDHTLNADGTISSKPSFSQAGFTGRTPESFINDLGLPFKVVDGEYYMGTTWWAYTQVYEGRICSTGGNYNSIGIESCVNEGSDLWYTWQLTAQLVARLMDENSLDITRVRGHHFYTAKNCPQPMLENDLEIWWEFLGLVEAEHELLTKYADYEISFESHNPEILDNNGRIVKQPSETTSVSYTITFTKDGQSQSVTLASMVQGLYVGR